MPETFDESIQTLANSITTLVISKQKKYGKSNILDFGENGVLVRMNDKFARLKNMVLNDIQDADEPIDDTLRDIIGYSLLWLMLRNNTFDLPLSNPSQTLMSKTSVKGFPKFNIYNAAGGAEE